MTISRAAAIRRLGQVLPLERQYEALKTENVCLHTELRHQQDFVSRLKFLLRERLTRIDDLNGKLEQARALIRKLGEENDHLAQLAKG
jgi:hypothetical protein